MITTLFCILHCIYSTSHFCFECVGNAPLHYAAKNGDTDLLNSICETPGCDVNVKVLYAYLVLVFVLGVKKCFDQFIAYCVSILS